MEIKKGIAVSPGISVARAFILDSEEYRIPLRYIDAKDIGKEITRYEDAIHLSVKELDNIRKRFARRLGEDAAPIVEAHMKMLQDEHVKAQVIENIKKNKYSPEYAISRVLRRYTKALYSAHDTFFTNRIQDINDIERRLLKNLLEERREELGDLKEPVILVAHDLSPTQTITLDRSKIKGFVTDVGGKTSHTAIIARMQGIPAVVGLNSISLDVSGGDTIIIDGNSGLVIIDPDEETIKKYSAMGKSYVVFEKKLIQELKGQPAVTKDGHKVTLFANVELPQEVPLALKYGAEGIGLFRTEFLYNTPQRAPTEREHFDVYKKIAVQSRDRQIVIRTMDLGADKIQVGGGNKEKNPFLGCRAIRFSLLNPDSFRTQLRAILRASEYGYISLMFPMISSLSELRDAKEILEDVKDKLTQDKIPFNQKLKVGIMIEVPSAAMIADLLIKEVDFFSIGTNDLIQYALAVDRGNECVASLYQPAHPAVLRLIKSVIDEGARHHKNVAMCGEMSGDWVYTVLLLGLGLKTFSMSPIVIPEVKKIIRSVTMVEAKKISAKAMASQNAQETADFLKEYTSRIVPQFS